MMGATYGKAAPFGAPISDNDVLEVCPRVASIPLPSLELAKVRLQLQKCESQILDEVHMLHNSELKDISKCFCSVLLFLHSRLFGTENMQLLLLAPARNNFIPVRNSVTEDLLIILYKVNFRMMRRLRLS